MIWIIYLTLGIGVLFNARFLYYLHQMLSLRSGLMNQSEFLEKLVRLIKANNINRAIRMCNRHAENNFALASRYVILRARTLMFPKEQKQELINDAVSDGIDGRDPVEDKKIWKILVTFSVITLVTATWYMVIDTIIVMGISYFILFGLNVAMMLRFSRVQQHEKDPKLRQGLSQIFDVLTTRELS